jgi:CRP/FNR family transcriptional regulator, dissimilatory nitrate respiration regulator
VSKLSQLKNVGVTMTLRNCQLFQGLPPADLEHIAQITVARALDKGEYLFRQGENSHGFYIVQRGAVNVHRVNPMGKEQVIHIFRPGETFAEASLATTSGYPADARAVEPSQVLLVQKSGFLELVKRQPELALRMLGSMAAHLRVLVGQLEDVTLKDVETRLANWLLKRCPDPNSSNPVVIELPSTKRVLAAELGTVSETLSRTFAKLKDQDLILVKTRSVTALNPSKLKEFVAARTI